ncbi:MAG: uracil-DNA glycosylase [Rickettsiales bacterium]|nr:uracil-DNA glycosylase [Rickettsiales bacterium]
MTFIPPSLDCPLCPRLVQFREENRRAYPAFFNAPVPSFGELSAELLIVGLAPGLKGANQTGRPFTGDYAGFILYPALQKTGFAKGDFLATLHETGLARSEEGLFAGTVQQASGEFKLVNCRITNAVRCVPQENKPEPSEIKNCNSFLSAEMAAMSRLKVVLSLGLVSHNAVLKARGFKASHAKFEHGAPHKLGDIILLNSYHCSRYNINTGRLSQAMFDAVVEKAKSLI